MGIVQVDEQTAGEKRQISLNAVENNIYNLRLNLKRKLYKITGGYKIGTSCSFASTWKQKR